MKLRYVLFLFCSHLLANNKSQKPIKQIPARPLVFIDLNSVFTPIQNLSATTQTHRSLEWDNLQKKADELHAHESAALQTHSKLHDELHETLKQGEINHETCKVKIQFHQKGREEAYQKYCCRCDDIAKAKEKVETKLKTIVQTIAKELNACAAVTVQNELYIHPEHDITKRAIEQLNHEYLAEQKTRKQE